MPRFNGSLDLGNIVDGAYVSLGAGEFTDYRTQPINVGDSGGLPVSNFATSNSSLGWGYVNAMAILHPEDGSVIMYWPLPRAMMIGPNQIVTFNTNSINLAIAAEGTVAAGEPIGTSAIMVGGLPGSPLPLFAGPNYDTSKLAVIKQMDSA